MTLPLLRLTRSRPARADVAASTTWFHGIRRAYDTLKLCVVGHLNESGVSELMPMLPMRLASVASLRRVVGQARAVAVAAAVPEVGVDLVGVRARGAACCRTRRCPCSGCRTCRSRRGATLLPSPSMSHATLTRGSANGAAVRQDAGRARSRCRRSRRRSAAGTCPGSRNEPLRRVVERRREVAAQAVQLLVVRPVAEAHAVFEREVRLELPAVLRERVDVPVAELAERLAGRRVALGRRALVELADAARPACRRRSCRCRCCCRCRTRAGRPRRSGSSAASGRARR